LCYKETTKEWRNEPRESEKSVARELSRDSRKMMRGNSILFWKVRCLRKLSWRQCHFCSGNFAAREGFLRLARSTLGCSFSLFSIKGEEKLIAKVWKFWQILYYWVVSLVLLFRSTCVKRVYEDEDDFHGSF
jgi:hypothetical protein